MPIPIEERDGCGSDRIQGMRWAPEGINVRNPAFDVTPAELVAAQALITERGVVASPDRVQDRSVAESRERTHIVTSSIFRQKRTRERGRCRINGQGRSTISSTSP